MTFSFVISQTLSRICKYQNKKQNEMFPMTDEAVWAADAMEVASYNLRECCETLARKHFECEHTRQLYIDNLKAYRHEVMKLLRHHYTYDINTDHTWLCAHSSLCNCMEHLTQVDAWCPVMEDERLYITACATHLYRKLFTE